ncbi:MAG: tRNA (adenosine(37)-N6)-dimethylallyltransferase MiaA [Verrucomicrobiaceae bacterium]|nr:tRNA (adenosine(37)-N6)-dimethylallyltransferase MiaA [Verrucomicrobiaceae bacterium]
MNRVFFIVGPTAVGKSELAAEVAGRLGAEIVSADAFQVYRGLDLLTAKPDQATLAKAPHHLIGTLPMSEEMNVEKYRAAAAKAIAEIQERGRSVIVVGGSGLYVKALTHGLAPLPAANRKLRDVLEQATIDELVRSLFALDPAGAKMIDRQNKRRLIRAVEVCLLTGRPFSEQRTHWPQPPAVVAAAVTGGRRLDLATSSPLPPGTAAATTGVFVYRDRAELYARINQRVEQMFEAGVAEELRGIGKVSETAEKTLGLADIRALLAGEISQPVCIAKIQQATRRYAKRQLTWFQRQTNFAALNLSAHGSSEAIELISQSASRVFANG